MSDLRQYLDRIAGPERDPSPGAVDADVARGRTALRRRRRLHGLAGGALALAVAAALGAGALGANTGTGVRSGPVVPHAGAAESPAGTDPVRLVAFTGDQPEGFRIDVVPEGWEIQSSTGTTLLIAPIGLANRDPNVFVDKITISFQYDAPAPDVPGEIVSVGGAPGVLRTGDSGVRTLYAAQRDGAWLVIQLWNNLRWDTGTIVAFAAGITVTDEVTASQG
ncbi:hypothetical protein [Catenuloplanes atrovinosus]|uniref:Uncharacterized protein n=1 Tax=Catenuloplanes atrovinosus TaxID=137266 RepID=A0AAE4CAS0_9ACTN|nr:hypothetical protein [Catenuloplanes atrovinosus]MDR7276104.1 hypothetical protein [Catenuloplanes atrovinosus]